MEKCVAQVNPRTAAANSPIGESDISESHGEERCAKEMMNRNLNEMEELK
jgi:hypothetical protein